MTRRVADIRIKRVSKNLERKEAPATAIALHVIVVSKRAALGGEPSDRLLPPHPWCHGRMGADYRRSRRSDHVAARLARDGDPESIAFEETDTSFQIAWPGNYRLDGPAFVYTDRQSRRVSTIIGYPMQLLAAAERR